MPTEGDPITQIALPVVAGVETCRSTFRVPLLEGICTAESTRDSRVGNSSKADDGIGGVSCR